VRSCVPRRRCRPIQAPVEATVSSSRRGADQRRKHADARGASVCAPGADGTLRLAVRDDGVGGAQLDGSGLVGLADRLSVLGGRLAIDSPRGGPTVIAGDIPLAGP
jgi:glucose-6-phosphate-specific signal transduction histidine kinase